MRPQTFLHLSPLYHRTTGSLSTCQSKPRQNWPIFWFLNELNVRGNHCQMTAIGKVLSPRTCQANSDTDPASVHSNIDLNFVPETHGGMVYIPVQSALKSVENFLKYLSKQLSPCRFVKNPSSTLGKVNSGRSANSQPAVSRVPPKFAQHSGLSVSPVREILFDFT